MKKLIAVGMYVGLILLPGCKEQEIGTDCKETPAFYILCSNEDNPVCGCDGVTYRNSCLAMAAGVKSSKPGACK